MNRTPPDPPTPEPLPAPEARARALRRLLTTVHDEAARGGLSVADVLEVVENLATVVRRSAARVEGGRGRLTSENRRPEGGR